MKKHYTKPSMKVYQLKKEPTILMTSSDWPVGYTPGQAEDEKQQA